MIVQDLEHLARPIDSLRFLPDNPRRGDVDAVARSLDRFGQRKPIVALTDGTVIAGNHTLEAARKLGWSEIAVVVTDDDDATAKAFALADNRTGDLGTYDDEALAAMVRDVVEFDDLIAATGWDEQSIADLLGVVPDFQPTDDEQPRLDERNPTRCPECGFEWRVAAGGKIEPV